MFSPYYAWARRRSPAAAENFCAVNVALYGAGVRRFALTERGRSALHASADALAIGPSSLEWCRDRWRVAIEERAAPWPRRVSGTVEIVPSALASHVESLDGAARHQWQPLAPVARATVRLTHPELNWQGCAYVDSNRGSEPLEQAFSRWHWSRTVGARTSDVLYDVTERDGRERCIALRFDEAGRATAIEAPPAAALPRSRWGLERPTRCAAGRAPRLVRALEDGPFYARSLIETETAPGAREWAIHEALSLERFSRPWVQLLLPFRMPRRP